MHGGWSSALSRSRVSRRATPGKAGGPSAEPAASQQGDEPPGTERLDYLVVGHVTKDLVPHAPSGYVLGGTVTFSSETAQHLGRRAAVLTRCEPLPELEPAFAGVALHRVPSDSTTTFENVYTPAGRVQHIRAIAPPIPADAVPQAWVQARVAHLGPVAQEVPPNLADHFGADTIVGVTPQGWLRAWNGDGQVVPAPWTHAEQVLARADVLVFSGEDVGGDQRLVERYCDLARLAVVTDHFNGCTIYQDGRRERFAAFEVEEVDPTGAGDVFAVAFLLRYAETKDASDAARYANCVASFVVQGQGTSTLPTPEQVEQRMRHGRLRSFAN